ncbi:guided entry of tail-anchored proteins factor 1 isoform X1 [Mobula birostris]|uniref:guided entry of tail-anchored proteins factor 1 isoform X1 n=1 Tax=Mobula birostris TaxID=1983395 RepID=UPI003B28045B
MAESCAWLLVLGSVLLCSLFKMLLPTLSLLIAKFLQKDGETELQMRIEIGNMKQELATISMMDEFARYARLERKINKMTDKLKTHVKTRTAQLAKIKWVVNIVFYIVQAALMISLIWKYYSEPVTVLPHKWIAPLERMVAFPTGVAEKGSQADSLRLGTVTALPKTARNCDVSTFGPFSFPVIVTIFISAR